MAPEPRNDAKLFVACEAEEDTSGAPLLDEVEFVVDVDVPNGNEDPEDGTAAGVEGAMVAPIEKGLDVFPPNPEKPANFGTGSACNV